VGKELKLTGNPRLKNLRALSALESAGAFQVEQNATLPTCEAEWLRDHVGVTQLGTPIVISGNDDSGVCTP
jgi:hypothetical protein